MAAANQGNPETAQSVYEFNVKDIKGNDVSMEKYRGHVLVIVNVASKCGYTAKHYAELNEIYDQYAESKGKPENIFMLLVTNCSYDSVLCVTNAIFFVLILFIGETIIRTEPEAMKAEQIFHSISIATTKDLGENIFFLLLLCEPLFSSFVSMR